MVRMADDKSVTPEEAGALRRKAAQASTERDVAVEAVMEAQGKEAIAREDAREQHAETHSAQESAIRASERAAIAKDNAREQHAEARSAQASAIRASEREAVAKDDAREQHMEAVSAQNEATYMNTLRRAANTRADSETRGNRSRFVFILLALVLLAGIATVVFLFIFRQASPRTPPTVRYLSLTGVPMLVRGGVTLYGVREVLEQDGWTVYWLGEQNVARAWKAGKGELLLRPGSATVPREEVSKASIQFTQEIVLQGERLYVPASFFQQLMEKRFRIDEESGRLQLRQ